MVAATIPFQWTGHVLVTGRTQLAEAFKEPECTSPGVYMLLGDRDGKPTLYVGETDEIRARIKQHAATKDWWERAIFITSSGEPLNKAHARFLEYQIFTLAKNIGRVELDNTQSPTRSPLSKAALSHMSDFLENLRLVLPALRFDFLTDQIESEESDSTTKSQNEFVYFVMEVQRYGVKARAKLDLTGNKFIVEAGSKARNKWVGSTTAQSTYAQLHAELVEDGVLVEEGDHLVYAKSYGFKSSSAAAAVTAGRPATGPGTWILEGTEKTYRDWEQEKLNADVSMPEVDVGNEVSAAIRGQGPLATASIEEARKMLQASSET